MANIGTLVASLDLDVTGLDAGLKSAEASLNSVGTSSNATTDEMSSGFGGVGNDIATISDAALRFRAILRSIVALGLAKFFKDAFTAAAEAQRSIQDLGAAIRLHGGNWDQLSVSVENFIDTMQNTFGVSDELVANAIRRFIDYGMSTKEAMATFQVAMDLAAGTGKTLEEAVNALARGYNGQTTALQRLVGGTDDAIDTGEKYESLLKRINELFAGRAQSRVGDMISKIDGLKESWGEFMETVGFMVAGKQNTNILIDPFKGALDVFVEEFSNSQAAVEKRIRRTMQYNNEQLNLLEGLGQGSTMLADFYRRELAIGDAALSKIIDKQHEAANAIDKTNRDNRQMFGPPVPNESDIAFARPAYLAEIDEETKKAEEIAKQSLERVLAARREFFDQWVSTQSIILQNSPADMLDPKLGELADEWRKYNAILSDPTASEASRELAQMRVDAILSETDAIEDLQATRKAEIEAIQIANNEFNKQPGRDFQSTSDFNEARVNALSEELGLINEILAQDKITRNSMVTNAQRYYAVAMSLVDLERQQMEEMRINADLIAEVIHSRMEAIARETEMLLRDSMDGLKGWIFDLSGELNNAFRDSFFKLLKGQFDDFYSFISAITDVFLRSISQQMANVFLSSDGIGGLIGGLLSSGSGSSTSSFTGMSPQTLDIPEFAAGGFVSRPTLALVGEAGPEMIVPMTKMRNERFMSGLGTANDNGNSVMVNFNIHTPDVASFKQSQSQIMAQAVSALGRARRDM